MNKWIAAILLLTGFFSCTVSSPPQSRRARPGKNNPGSNQIERLTARIKLFHLSTDSSRIYFSFNARKQDYYLLGDHSKYKASYRLTYEIIRSDNGKKSKQDSSSLKLVDLQPVAENTPITAFIDARIPEHNNYVLKLSIVNLNNGARYDYYNKFTKSNCTDPENIMIVSDDGSPLLEKNYIYTTGNIYLRKGCDQGLTLKSVKGGMSLPTPPFGSDDFASKNNYSTFTFNIEKEGDHYTFSDLDKGVYLVSTGENSGVIFYHFNKWYPNCNDTSGFYEPLVYISSKDEYEEFKSTNSTKVPFENFWLARAGDKVGARKAINEYFKRVFEANADFTAIQEGWRTDRGMVYIVFGKPGYVEKQLNKETWIYNTPFNTSLSFTFYKIDNPYSDNDYRLERDMQYKPQWYNAVENWRRGKPFNLNGT